jgi:hypothetical protein
MVFPDSARMKMAMDWFRNSGLWPADRYVFADVDFVRSLITDRPEMTELERPTVTGTDFFYFA